MSVFERRDVATLSLSPRVAARVLHPATGLASVDLRAIAAGLAASATDVPLDRHEPHRDFRCVLSTSAYDAWVIRWRPRAELDLHDHGGARGVLHVADGELHEQYADRRSPHALRSRTVSAGTSITISASTVHAVANVGPADALSVHVYSPPLSTMTFYEASAGSLAAVRSTEAATASRSELVGHGVPS